MNKLSLVAAALILCACGQKSETPAPQAAQTSAPAEVPAEVQEVAAAAQVGTLPAAPSGLNGQPVDTCAMLDRATVEKVAGTLFKDPEAAKPTGSLLGQCDYIGPDAMVMLSARPASEYQGTVDYSSKKGGAKPVEGLAGPATSTNVGLMLQPPGKDYFLVVYALSQGAFNENAAIELARALKL